MVSIHQIYRACARTGASDPGRIVELPSCIENPGAYQHNGPAAVVAPVAAGPGVADTVLARLPAQFLANHLRVGIAGVAGLRLGRGVLRAREGQPAGHGQRRQDADSDSLAQPPKQLLAYVMRGGGVNLPMRLIIRSTLHCLLTSLPCDRQRYHKIGLISKPVEPP